MKDFQLCNGGECPFRQHCWRFLSPRDGLDHFFDEPPYKLIDIGASARESSTGKMFECDFFTNRDRAEVTFSIRSR